MSMVYIMPTTNKKIFKIDIVFSFLQKQLLWN